jgi:hypothetical protein
MKCKIFFMTDRTNFVIACILLFGMMPGLLFCLDYKYQVTSRYETDDQGKILQQQPYNGWIILHNNGTYKLQFHIYDEGSYQYVTANPQQPNDTIYFNSRNNFRFFAYPRQNTLEIWLQKTNTGTNQWVHAELSAAPPPVQSPAATGTTGASVPTGNKNISVGSLIKNGVFSRKVIYGNTSISSYYLYDRTTGEISADEKGIIFRPNGTYFLRSEFGSSVIEEKGNYQIVGDQVRIIFQDNSSMTLTLMDGGKSLHWYNQGMLISEYLFLGVVE